VDGSRAIDPGAWIYTQRRFTGFFEVSVDHLFAAPVLIEYFDARGAKPHWEWSPDAGCVERARGVRRSDWIFALGAHRFKRRNGE